jgi:anti-anti-sigma factor
MICPTKTKVERHGDTVAMRFAGDIVSTSEEAVLGVYRRLKPGVVAILLDFSLTPYLNSSGIALVIQLLVEAHRAGQKVVCFGLTAHFIKVFKLLGLPRYTSLHSDEASARAAATS